MSGSVGAAEAAQLVILVGAREEEIKVFQPYFDAMGKKTISFGGVGKGSAAKLAINQLLAVTVQAVGETLIFSEKLGLDNEKIFEMISNSGMNTGVFQTKIDMYRKQSFPSAFMLELMAKDLGLITSQTDRMALDLPLTRTAHAAYIDARDNGKARMDLAAIYLALKEKNA